ncbi:arsenical pump-driving ATPase [Agromyces aurantiacus]|uniref:Arsenical pump-driving ATPase n=1 Tax=Agromyces aurantiacus TaxID=165814 RepID=A0ABV9R3I4_9MICO|nr:arsenical pump-driving ATPase [Agromyces aurantiacus]MBM7502684.1 arsenite-transporting ATPase [Agromyces aurantiacus]
MKFLDDLPRFLFFTGKGGVGKTSVACASAVRLADAGRRVLLVSTDPASNIGQVFGLTVGNAITPIPSVPGLSALEIDPEAAADAYRERIIGPLRGTLPAEEIEGVTESLSGSCTTEIASFDEFTELLTGGAASRGYDHVIFDTAPTGHTVRLLQLPGSWSEFLTAGGDASCLGPLSGLERHKATYANAVQALTDPSRTRLVLVTRAQRSALDELERTYAELAEIGMPEGYVVVNGVLPDSAGTEPLTAAVRRREAAALAAMPPRVSALPRDVVDLRPENVVGVDQVRALFSPAAPVPAGERDPGDVPLDGAGLSALIDEIERDGRGLVMCMGKGGVGKTTVAAAVAVRLALRGHEVLLTTTDPAAHLAQTLDGGGLDNLTVSRIDPGAAIRAYRERVMAAKGKGLDDEERAALAEDLMSPCNDEVAVFHEFSRAISESRRRFVVIDTAPTGHTLLLLDATGSYHREVTRQMGDGAGFVTPLMRLQDPALTKVILVTLAETTPVLEAEELAADLRRAGIEPWAWVVDGSIAAAEPASPFLRRRARNELDQIERVRREAERVAIVPLLAEEPVGVARLAALSESIPQRA